LLAWELAVGISETVDLLAFELVGSSDDSEDISGILGM
jgi:hypothetical protein